MDAGGDIIPLLKVGIVLKSGGVDHEPIVKPFLVSSLGDPNQFGAGRTIE